MESIRNIVLRDPWAEIWAKKRLLRKLGDLLFTAKKSAGRAHDVLDRRLLERFAELPESKQVLLLLFYPATLGRGDTSEAVGRLLAALEELLNEALESVLTSHSLCEKQEGTFWWCSFRRFYRFHLLEVPMEYDNLFTEKLTLGDTAGQGDGSDTVRSLLTRVTEALRAAEQCLQSPDAEAHTSEAFRRILTEALQLASTALGCASTLYGARPEHWALCEDARSLLATLTEHLRKAASVVRSYRESNEGLDGSAATGNPDDCLSVLRSYRIKAERATASVGQDEAARAAESLSRQLEALLISMKSALRTWDGAVQGLVDNHGEHPSSSPVSVGQGGCTSSQGDPGDTVLRLLTRVTEALTAAEQCLQSPDDHTSEASWRILTEALQLASTAHSCVSTLYGVRPEHWALFEDARSLLAALAEHLRKAASLVGSYRVSTERAAVPVGQGGGTSSQGVASVALQSLARDISQLWAEGQTVLRRYCPTIRQGGEAAGQGGGDPCQGGDTAGNGGDPADKGGGDAAGQGDKSGAFPLLMMPLAELVRSTQDTVLTFRKLTVYQKQLPGAARSLFKVLAELLTVTESLVTSHRVNKGRGDKSVTGQLPLLAGPSGEKQKDPEPNSYCDNGWTGFLKSVWKELTKYPVLAAVVVIAGLVACILVLRNNQHTEQQVQIKGVQSSAAETGKAGQVLPPCGYGWIWYRNKCYYFSEAEGNWAEAKDSCAALNSSLAMIDTQKELNFMLRYKGDHNHWIGLRRDDKSQLWTWVNGAKFNNCFTVSDTSECAYLSYGQVKSLECDITNKWICTKVTINSI